MLEEDPTPTVDVGEEYYFSIDRIGHKRSSGLISPCSRIRMQYSKSIRKVSSGKADVVAPLSRSTTIGLPPRLTIVWVA